MSRSLRSNVEIEPDDSYSVYNFCEENNERTITFQECEMSNKFSDISEGSVIFSGTESNSCMSDYISLSGFKNSDPDYIPSGSSSEESPDISDEIPARVMSKELGIPVPKCHCSSKGLNNLITPEILRNSAQSDSSINVLPTTSGTENLQNRMPPNLSLDHKEKYIKSASARERPTICPICFNDVITHFTRHLFRHHTNNEQVKLLKSFKPRSKERLALVAALRKQGYFYLKTEKNILFPVKSSANRNVEYFTCIYCLGHYSKKLLSRHVKTCRNRPANDLKPGKKCLTKSQTFMALVNMKNHDFLKSSRIKNEVFTIMRPDNISYVAKNDPLTCLYGENLLSKHKRQQIATVVSYKIREMARILISIRSLGVEAQGFFDILKPDMFQSIVSATKIVSGYNERKKGFDAPSLALHMGTNLKVICNVGLKLVLENKKIPHINYSNREEKKTEIKDLKKLIEGHWCSELSSLALKNLNEKQWIKPLALPLTTDMEKFKKFIDDRATVSFNKLKLGVDIKSNYKILTECVLAQTVMFNRKRVGEVQYLSIDTYKRDFRTMNQDSFVQSLSELEKIMCKSFKRVITGGKGSRPVPILFSKQTQTYIACLLTIREQTDVVPKSNSYLFANPNSENHWMSGNTVIQKLAKNSGAEHPELLTSTKFRKHIATTLQLMSMTEDEIEQIATFMGHTKKTHIEFYRLPQDIYQTSKVAKVLRLLEKGRGGQFRGKNLNEIELENNIYYSSESEHEEIQLNNISPDVGNSNKTSTLSVLETNSHEPQVIDIELEEPKKVTEKKITGRVPWTKKEKDLVLKYFSGHIKKMITPRKHECDAFLTSHKGNLTNKDWVKVKTLVYNSFRTK